MASKYFIDTSVTGTLPAQYLVDEGDGISSIYPGSLYLPYPIEISFGSSTFSSSFKYFCENVLLDGDDISFMVNSKDSLKQLIIPANTQIENYYTSSFPYCKAVKYQTKL